MTSVLNSLIKLPRYVRILSTNGIDKTTAIVDKTEYGKQYYQKNRARILERKRAYNSRPEVKKRSKELHHQYYLIHKEELYKKQKEYLRNKKNGTLSQMQ